ncbi:phosphatidylinositol glycan, class M [Angomonas deanei]|nr:phosphatidylinositol glycan, class M [Angomonas deanei]|eukprot:EPY42879.1 phosphatidylinositol glycan, class M [Angomonas deanei]
MAGKSDTSIMDKLSITHLLIFGIVVRAILLIFAEYQDRNFRVKYTDIDYMIVVDGAREMYGGGTPFDRTTYRYTPLLAVLALPAVLIANPLGKVVFTLADVGAAFYAYKVLTKFATERSAKWMVSFFILFNPIVLNVSTRGNSDMLITFMSMFVLSRFFDKKYFSAAAMLGFAVHLKIYPIIYALPLVLGVIENSEGRSYIKKFMNAFPTILLCGILFVVCFAVPTYLCYLKFGYRYLYEALIYHFYREDHRHNFSPYWLLMYINMGRRAMGVGVDHSAGLFAFIPQFIVLFYSAWRLRRNIAHACCVQTVLFIAFNKVCTVQYFVWFIPFLPFVFCEPLNTATGKKSARPSLWTMCAAFTLWSLTIPLWVVTAYPLEFEGKNLFGRLWIVSCVFYMATILFASWLGRVCLRIQRAESVGIKHD